MQTGITTTAQEISLSGLDIGACKLSFGKDLTTTDGDISLLITKEGADKINRFLRVENGRDSAIALITFVDLILDKDLFSLTNYKTGTVAGILTKMVVIDLPDSYNQKLVSLLSSEDKNLSQKAACILTCHEYGPAYKDPIVFLQSKLINGLENSDLPVFRKIVERFFIKESKSSSSKVVQEKLLKDLNEVARLLSPDISKLDSAKADTFKEQIKILNKFKSIILGLYNQNENKTIKATKQKKPAIPKATRKYEAPVKTEEPLAPNTVNVDQVKKAVMKYGDEPIDILDSSVPKRSPDLRPKTESELSSILKDPNHWNRVSPAEIAVISINFVKRVADKGPLSLETQAKLVIHFELIAKNLDSQMRDLNILASLLDKNMMSQDILATFYLLQLSNPKRVTAVISGLNTIGFDKKTLACRLNQAVCKAALQLKPGDKDLAKSMENLIELFSLRFDLEDLHS